MGGDEGLRGAIWPEIRTVRLRGVSIRSLRVRRLWPQEEDDDLYTNADQRDEDQRPGDRLLAGVQVAAQREEDRAQGEEQHPEEHPPNTSPATGPAENSNPEPTLNERFSQRGARLASNSCMAPRFLFAISCERVRRSRRRSSGEVRPEGQDAERERRQPAREHPQPRHHVYAALGDGAEAPAAFSPAAPDQGVERP